MKTLKPADRLSSRPPGTSKTPPGKRTESFSEVLRQLGPYLNIGYMFVASVLVLALLGWLADRKWGTLPWFTLLGALLGIAAGFYNFFKVVSRPPKGDSSDEPS